MKIKLLLITGVTLFNTHIVEGLEAPCYGYGAVYGKPDKLMKDDMDRIVENNFGKDGVFLSKIDFYFEGKSYLNVFWSDQDEPDKPAISGWRHGASPYGTQPFYPSSF